MRLILAKWLWWMNSNLQECSRSGHKQSKRTEGTDCAPSAMSGNPTDATIARSVGFVCCVWITIVLGSANVLVMVTRDILSNFFSTVVCILR